MEIFKAILNLLKLSNPSNIPGADDLVPVLVYVIIKANPPALLSMIQYVEAYEPVKFSSLISEKNVLGWSWGRLVLLDAVYRRMQIHSNDRALNCSKIHPHFSFTFTPFLPTEKINLLSLLLTFHLFSTPKFFLLYRWFILFNIFINGPFIYNTRRYSSEFKFFIKQKCLFLQCHIQTKILRNDNFQPCLIILV